MKISQEKNIYNHLVLFGSITPLEALKKYGVFRLSGRIYDLRNLYNIDIRTEIVTINKKRFAKYILIPDGKKDLTKLNKLIR